MYQVPRNSLDYSAMALQGLARLSETSTLTLKHGYFSAIYRSLPNRAGVFGGATSRQCSYLPALGYGSTCTD